MKFLKLKGNGIKINRKVGLPTSSVSEVSINK